MTSPGSAGMEFFGDPGPDMPGSGPPMGSIEPSMPHSLEAEREVLAAVLVDRHALDTIQEHLTAEDFYFERHMLLYSTMAELHEAGEPIDPVSLQQALKDRSLWEKVGGARSIGELFDRVGTLGNLEHYCEIVRRKGMTRRMVEVAKEIQTQGLQDIADVDEFLDEAERQVFGVLENRQTSALRPIAEIVTAAIDQIAAAFDSEGDVTGIGTGFRDFDKLTHGLQRGDLVIVAARPAMGKTSFVLNLAANAAMRHGATVALFSLEMPSEQLVSRLLSSEARVDLGRLRGGYISDDEWPRLTEAADRVSSAPIYMDDSPGVSPMMVRAKCRRLSRRHGLDLVIIDYLQLMSGGGGRERSREQEISYISRSLKGLAKDLRVPVIALSQLNRGLESRTDKRPLMSDLRESGAIEQDADMICFIYREEVYKKDLEESQRGIAELIIGKHRNGPTGTVKLKFWQNYTRFDNLALHMEPP